MIRFDPVGGKNEDDEYFDLLQVLSDK